MYGCRMNPCKKTRIKKKLIIRSHVDIQFIQSIKWVAAVVIVCPFKLQFVVNKMELRTPAQNY
jgi:hypothetical protein